ncbi:conjugative transposon protein TraK [Chryseobacterium indologenes]|uniref:Conjugative transposon protein TraK n=3 Tax=Chryseobacterium TaxID=59732 RepID=A0A3G6RPH5_CHRLC|nr:MULTISPECIES: conjugative transposon protein TraK [Bacteroidota]AZA84549.1 conjugative transposon protein TraK [Chryseobacterium lactis]AZB04937.1 conjugative transposon protein TraK [Chryseobacterium lactis]KMQ64415.1 conjugal transfer protein [Chryseobacterium angstadtii]MBF6643644.1 conjugative transposon protein TraK [Chryseobacterium indologenes]PNW14668.1 conjugative transposon protein TraK [Chryseobacterium lactis]
MEFKTLRNIENSFRQIRLYAIIFALLCTGIVGYAIWKSYSFAEKQREKIYVLDQGKSLMLALAQDASINRPVEAREHVRRFHELFFTLAPDKNAIESNMKRAFNLADKSVFDYYNDLAEKGYYNRIISGNVQQRVEVDSVICNFDSYPYSVKTYSTQFIIRSSNVTKRNLVTSCNLLNSVRSDNNPQGFNIEKFAVLENRDLEVVER